LRLCSSFARLHDFPPQILRIGSRHDGTFGIAYRPIRLVFWGYVPFAVMKSALAL
jgi:hypothetical protein